MSHMSLATHHTFKPVVIDYISSGWVFFYIFFTFISPNLITLLYSGDLEGFSIRFLAIKFHN